MSGNGVNTYETREHRWNYMRDLVLRTVFTSLLYAAVPVSCVRFRNFSNFHLAFQAQNSITEQDFFSLSSLQCVFAFIDLFVCVVIDLFSVLITVTCLSSSPSPSPHTPSLPFSHFVRMDLPSYKNGRRLIDWLIDWLIKLYFSTVKILAQRPTHISAVATVLLVNKTFIVKCYDRNI